MSTDYKFEGWMGLDKNSIGNMKYQEFTPKPFEDDDIDIAITHSGICGSDIHTLRSGWGETDYPVCVGHEIVGKAVRVGKSVTHIRVGDRCGVGAQAASCLKPDCAACSDGEENHCPHMVNTFGGRFSDGSKSYGGYASHHRAKGHFTMKIPERIPSAEAAPMLCGGVTVYSPLVKNGCGPGKSVGIVGVGGLGHFGILFAKALGATSVTAISRSRGKEADARKMGATDFIATQEEGWETKNANSLDLIVSTVSSPEMPLGGYLSLLKLRGQFIQVGAPEDSISFNMFSLIGKAATVGGSLIGSPGEIKEMLELAASKGVKPWINEVPMKDANQATIDMDKGKARYRFCLVN